MTFKHLQLSRPLAVIDCETTGTDPETDRVVELAVIVVDIDGTNTDRSRRLNPGVPIPAGATAVHGITDADVADCPTFANVARGLASILEPCDLAGYGIVRFDIPILDAEFERAGVAFDWSARAIVDGLLIFHAKEPRDLAAAIGRYVGIEHDGAHSAEADARAAAAVIDAQVAVYPDLPRDLAVLAAMYDDPARVDWGRKLQRDDDGRICFRFGKHKGEPLTEVVNTDRPYLEWMVSKRATFRHEVTTHVRAVLDATPKPKKAAKSDRDAEQFEMPHGMPRA